VLLAIPIPDVVLDPDGLYEMNDVEDLFDEEDEKGYPEPEHESSDRSRPSMTTHGFKACWILRG
jgi:hypothetical protein